MHLVPSHKNFQEFDPSFPAQLSARFRQLDASCHRAPHKAGQENLSQIPENFCGQVLESLYIRGFRNFEEAFITFSPKINVIYGENGAGKTSLLEAISLLSSGRSFRTEQLRHLIRQKDPFFYLEGKVKKGDLSHTIQLFFDAKKKTLKIDSHESASFQPLLGLLPLVLFAPTDEEWVGGSPQLRRKFLNLHLAQSDPLYVYYLARFHRAKNQRNCLLRMKKETLLDCFEEEMIESAFPLFQKRKKLIEDLNLLLIEKSRTLSSAKEEHTLSFHPSYPETKEEYRKLLSKSRKREMEIGNTLFGPHRDDVSFWISGLDAKLFSSVGQKKTLAASLKLAEWEKLSTTLGEKPLFAIDDLGLPLDKTREKKLVESLEALGQVFITVPEVPKELSHYSCLEVKNFK